MIGKIVYITDKESIYYGEWGRVVSVNEDGEYLIAIANGTDSLPIFDRKQFKIRKEQRQ